MRLLLSALVLGALAAPALAQDNPATPKEGDLSQPAPEAPVAKPEPAKPANEKSAGAVEFRFGYYDNDDGDSDGNPFLDESLTDIEGIMIFEWQATEKLRLSLTGSYDLVSSASIERLGNYEQQSGASGDYYIGLDIGASYAVSEDFRWNAHGGASFEYDYTSFGAGGGFEVDLLEDNVTLSAGVNLYVDQITKVVRFNGEGDGSDQRLSFTLNLGYYQLLTPTLHFSLGTSLTYQSGFLQTAYNGVVLEDPNNPLSDNLDPELFIDLRRLPAGATIEAEKLPETRLRAAIYGEIRQGFPSTGTGLGFAMRLYGDTWGITSIAPELRLYQWIVPDLLRIRARYRFYTQSAADAYKEHFRVPLGARSLNVLDPNEERTQDSDLGAFFSNTIGLKLILTPAEGLSIDLGGDYVLRSDGIDQLLFNFGFRWEF